MAKISDVVKKAKTPTGKEVNVLDPMEWAKWIAGGTFALFIAGLSLKTWRAVDNKLTMVDGSIQDPIKLSNPVPVSAGNTVI